MSTGYDVNDGYNGGGDGSTPPDLSKYIEKNGTTETTAEIPFEEGISIPDGKSAKTNSIIDTNDVTILERDLDTEKTTIKDANDNVIFENDPVNDSMRLSFFNNVSTRIADLIMSGIDGISLKFYTALAGLKLYANASVLSDPQDVYRYYAGQDGFQLQNLPFGTIAPNGFVGVNASGKLVQDDLSSDTNFIKVDGTSTTSAWIPFLNGFGVPNILGGAKLFDVDATGSMVAQEVFLPNRTAPAFWLSNTGTIRAQAPIELFENQVNIFDNRLVMDYVSNLGVLGVRQNEIISNNFYTSIRFFDNTIEIHDSDVNPNSGIFDIKTTFKYSKTAPTVGQYLRATNVDGTLDWATLPAIPTLDYKVKNSANDTTPNYVSSKLSVHPTAPSTVLTTINPSGDEKTQIDLKFAVGNSTKLALGLASDGVYTPTTATDGDATSTNGSNNAWVQNQFSYSKLITTFNASITFTTAETRVAFVDINCVLTANMTITVAGTSNRGRPITFRNRSTGNFTVTIRNTTATNVFVIPQGVTTEVLIFSTDTALAIGALSSPSSNLMSATPNRHLSTCDVIGSNLAGTYFTALIPEANVNSVSMSIYQTSNISTAFTIGIYTYSGGTFTRISFATVPVQNNRGLQTFTLSSPFTLLAGQVYYVACAFPSAGAYTGAMAGFAPSTSLGGAFIGSSGFVFNFESSVTNLSTAPTISYTGGNPATMPYLRIS
jgi:hypothetical protein